MHYCKRTGKSYSISQFKQQADCHQFNYSKQAHWALHHLQNYQSMHRQASLAIHNTMHQPFILCLPYIIPGIMSINYVAAGQTLMILFCLMNKKHSRIWVWRRFLIYPTFDPAWLSDSTIRIGRYETRVCNWRTQTFTKITLTRNSTTTKVSTTRTCSSEDLINFY